MPAALTPVNWCAGRWLYGAGFLWLSACGGSGSGVSPQPLPIPPAVTNSPGSLVVAGDAQVGSMLAASVSDDNGTTTSTFGFQWFVDGVAIDGATAGMLDLTAMLEAGAVTVEVSYTDDDGFSETLTSSPTDPIAAAPGPVTDGNFVRGTVGDNDSVPDINCTQTVATVSELDSLATRDMVPGTTLCLAAGSYSGFDLDFGGPGTQSEPITVAAEVPGEVFIGGAGRIRMSGEYVVLQGFIFQDATSINGDFLATRSGSGTPCNRCRVVDNAFIDIDEVTSNDNKWVNIFGQFTRVDHNWFSGKTNEGALLVVTRSVPSGGTLADVEIDYAQIDHNYFGDRAPADGKAYADGSDNGYEAIRIGTSDSHAGDSFTVLEHNYFERIDGESEVISNKSGNNTLYNNTIRDSFGSLTMRHGASAMVEANFILGDGHPFAGGIRVIDDSHRIVNNYVEGARYTGSRFHGGIVLHASDGSTSNGYQILTDVFVANNTIVDSNASLNVNGGTRTIDPERVVFVNNVIVNAVGPVITRADEGMPADSVYAGNFVYGQAFSDNDAITSVPGFTWLDVAFDDDALGIDRWSDQSPLIEADTAFDARGFAPVDGDMDGDTRSGTTDSGADHRAATAPVIGVLTPFDVGPIAYRPPVTPPRIARIPLANPGFDSALASWTVTPPTDITQDSDEVFARGQSLRLAGMPARAAQTVMLEPGRSYEWTAFTQGPVRLGASIEGAETTVEDDNSSYRLTRLTIVAGASGDVTLFVEARDDETAFADDVRLVAYPAD